MINHSENLLEILSKMLTGQKLKTGYFGIEKESLRFDNEYISRFDHKDLLGHPLFNRYITTDFSEALIEIITPPISNKNDCYKFLDDIHHFVSMNIDGEMLWPFSMPPFFNSENDIKIASFGISNEGLFKELYRKGLANRYGRLMQSIAGLHFNYSFHESFWDIPILKKYNLPKRTLKEIIYFRTLRNIQRYNWIILFLFGASPVVSKNFLNRGIEGFEEIEDSYHLRYATSLRMSELGYQPASQSNLEISLDSLSDYAGDLLRATKSDSKTFKKIFSENKDIDSQINSNVLQTEDEYYSIARPKSSSDNHQRLISKLVKSGVDYIELRSMDLNPFSRVGIEKDTIDFLELFIATCAFMPSPRISKLELEEIKYNHRIVSIKGRKENLCLKKNGQDILLKEWANQMIDNIQEASKLFNADQVNFEDFKDKIDNPNKTLSGKILNIMRSDKIGFHDLAKDYAKEHREHYLNIDKNKNSNWVKFSEEIIIANNKQKDIEKSDDKPFQQHVDGYFKS